MYNIWHVIDGLFNAKLVKLECKGDERIGATKDSIERRIISFFS